MVLLCFAMVSNRVLWLVRARARQSANLQVNFKLTPGPGLRLFWADCIGKACFATDLGFKEIHVDARAGYVMAARGAGDAAGPAPRHQPSESGKAIYIYCDCSS